MTTPESQSASDAIHDAILQTLTYADLFDYPLTPAEVYQYLIGVRTSRAKVEHALHNGLQRDRRVASVGGYFTLPNRQSLVGVRAQRRALAHPQLAHAWQYARVIAHFPFVRMIALTGGLAMENAHDHDIDLLIVTQPKRLWLVRGLAVTLVRLVRQRGDQLCPNFLLSENALALADHNLYQAHELIQMIPLYGSAIYQRMRQSNAWAFTYLPNTQDAQRTPSEIQLGAVGARIKHWWEQRLNGQLGDRIEQWEMRRKIAKLSKQIPAAVVEANFSADVCRGFLNAHGSRVLNQFRARMDQMDAAQDRSV